MKLGLDGTSATFALKRRLKRKQIYKRTFLFWGGTLWRNTNCKGRPEGKTGIRRIHRRGERGISSPEKNIWKRPSSQDPSSVVPKKNPGRRSSKPTRPTCRGEGRLRSSKIRTNRGGRQMGIGRG